MTREHDSILTELIGRDSGQVPDLPKVRRETIEKPVIYIGMGSCGRIAGAKETEVALRAYLELHGIDADIEAVGCLGLCSQEPLMDVQLPGKARLSFARVSPELVPEILGAIFSNTVLYEHSLGQFRSKASEPVARLVYLQ